MVVILVQRRDSIFWEQQLQDSSGCRDDNNSRALVSLCITIKEHISNVYVQVDLLTLLFS